MGVCPAAASALQVCDPMYPAPPATNTRTVWILRWFAYATEPAASSSVSEVIAL